MLILLYFNSILYSRRLPQSTLSVILSEHNIFISRKSPLSTTCSHSPDACPSEKIRDKKLSSFL